MGRLPGIVLSQEIRFLVPSNVHANVRHHVKRLGIGIHNLMRDAVNARLKFLDEEEAEAIAHKRARNRKAFVPSVPQHRHNEIPTLRKRKMMQGTPAPISFASAEHTQISEKLQRGFPRWAEYIEEAEDRIDADRRAKIVLDEMRDRAVSEVEVTACFDQFKDFLSDRKNARATPSHVVDVSKLSMIAGDIAD